MQMHNVETNAGRAISCEPVMMASSSGFPEVMWRWMFSIATVASSTRMPTASARPPRVIRLIVSPSALNVAMEQSTESGMDRAMMNVLRHEPRNNRIIKAVNAAAMAPSRKTPLTAARTNRDWSANSLTCKSGETVAITPGRAALTLRTTSSVEAEPAFMMVSSAPFTPSWRTAFCCGV